LLSLFSKYSSTMSAAVRSASYSVSILDFVSSPLMRNIMSRVIPVVTIRSTI
jgi:hypothetical protein